MTRSWGRTLLRAWPLVTLIVLAVVFVLMLIFSRKAPVIVSLEPAMAAPGEQVVILGDYFGRTEREGSLSLAGEIPPPSLIQSWTDQKIVFTVPEDASSGLVTVSNSQGTSTGVLFTNTRSIPTVLQPASAPGLPLLVAVVPMQPASGQVVTLTGRGFGTGEGKGLVQIRAAAQGPTFELAPPDCLLWSDRSVSFRWPAGAGAASTVVVTTAQGATAAFALEASSPLAFEDPRSLTVTVSVTASPASGVATVLWGPVPQRTTATGWSLDSVQPPTASDTGPLVFRWPAGSNAERRATYQLTLQTWARRWDGFPAGSVATAEAPRGDERVPAWWKPAQASFKGLTAKWGLDTPDPWLRVQRLHTGLVAAFSLSAQGTLVDGLARAPAEILASGKLDSVEAASLGVALAAPLGVPGRLVTGLWSDGRIVQPRVWAELWFAGAGWIPWDPAEGPPGTLDNRHFAFETSFAAPVRLEARAKLLRPSAPWSQGEAAGEAAWSSQEPVVQWEIKRTEK